MFTGVPFEISLKVSPGISFWGFPVFLTGIIPEIPTYVSHIFAGSLVEFLRVCVTKLIPGFILLFFPRFLAEFLLGCSLEYLQEFFSWYSWSSSEDFNRSSSWAFTRSLVWDLSFRDFLRITFMRFVSCILAEILLDCLQVFLSVFVFCKTLPGNLGFRLQFF